MDWTRYNKAEDVLGFLETLTKERRLAVIAIRNFQYQVMQDRDEADDYYAMRVGMPTAVLTCDMTALFPNWSVAWFARTTGQKVALPSKGQYPSPVAALEAIRGDFDVLEARRRLGA